MGVLEYTRGIWSPQFATKNPKIYKYEVQFDSDFKKNMTDEELYELAEWVYNDCKGRVFTSDASSWYFEKRYDAVAFKLRWT